jgi:hypothetical protein
LARLLLPAALLAALASGFLLLLAGLLLPAALLTTLSALLATLLLATLARIFIRHDSTLLLREPPHE